MMPPSRTHPPIALQASSPLRYPRCRGGVGDGDATAGTGIVAAVGATGRAVVISNAPPQASANATHKALAAGWRQSGLVRPATSSATPAARREDQ